MGGGHFVSEPSHAVFLSYASQDAPAAHRISETLRAAGIEVWFDQSELRGGDAWDHSIRRQIKSCALFIPVISQTTHERDEGYFRLEWKLAVDRCHLMAADRTFLLPVVVDDTREDDDRVPERFRDVQWTRLRGGATPPAFVERVRLLLSLPSSTTTGAPASGTSGSVAPTSGRAQASSGARVAAIALAAVLVLAAAAWFVSDRLGNRRATVPTPAVAAASPAPAAFAPPPHSIAVLPFVNLSGDPGQDYFSDGLTEELLNSLAAVDGLQVAARTSSFSFKGKDTDIPTIARKLDVGAVLEGSVRRSGRTVRITAQLIDAVSGFHVWSKTYDRNLSDVLKLQTEIATAVADALRVTLLTDTRAKIELGGTRNPEAFDSYLRATMASNVGGDAANYLNAIAAYTDAIRLDPNYALALAGRSFVESLYASQGAVGPAVRESFEKALADGRAAVALAPELADGHLALAFYFANGALDFRQASPEFERARALAPGKASILGTYGLFAVTVGRIEPGLADLKRAAALDPLNVVSHFVLGRGLYWSRRYEEALAALEEAATLDASYLPIYEYRGLAYYGLGNFEKARAACEPKPAYWGAQWCLAVSYEKLGRRADAEASLAKLKQLQGNSAAYQYATIYAQWGDAPKALEWLETALKVRDPGVTLMKDDPFMDSLRKEPRFQAIERELNFPQD